MTGSVIAIVDDDAYIGDMLEELLRREGYGVLRAYSGTEALMLLEDRRPDLILLDLMLPGLNGEEVLPHLTGIPVIVLSARAAVEDKVDLLQGGAADYLTKPFDTRELLARIAVQLRRQSRQDGILRYRGIALAPETREATVDGGAVRLTRTEYGILKLLMQNPRQVITKSQLLEQYGYAGLRGEFVKGTCQQSPPEAPGGRGGGGHRVSVGDRLQAGGMI